MKIQFFVNMPILVGGIAAILLVVTGVQIPVLLSTGALTPFPLWNFFLISLALLGLGGIFSRLRYPGTMEEAYKKLTSAIKDIRDEGNLPSIPLLIGLFAFILLLLLGLYALTVFLFSLFLGPVQTALTIAVLTTFGSAILQRTNKVQNALDDLNPGLNQGRQNHLLNIMVDIATFGIGATQVYLGTSVYLTHGIASTVAFFLLPATITYSPLLIIAFKAESEG
jgi:hypothetical protein